MDDDIFEFQAPAEVAPELVLGKKKKKKKKKKAEPAVDEITPDKQTEHEHAASAANGDNDSPFAALAVDQDGAAAPSSAFAALEIEPNDENFVATPAASKKKKKSKKKKQLVLADPEDIDIVKTDEQDDPEPVAEPQQVEDSIQENRRPMTAAQKKKAKKERERLAKLEKEKKEQDEFNAMLAELGEAPPADNSAISGDKGAPAGEDSPMDAPMTAARQKRAKKKKKAAEGKTDEQDDIAALLAELEPASSKPDEAGTSHGLGESSGGGVDDLLAELGGGDAPATKKKSKKKKKKGGAKADGDGVEVVAGETGEGSSESKKPKKKESAAVRRMREQREKMLAEEERLRKLQEEEEARILEEERIREEQEKKKAEDKARKKAAEKAKRDRKRQDGTLLSKAEKERKRKAEAFRKQMIAQGMVPAVNEKANIVDAIETGPKGRVVYSSRRKNNRQQATEQTSVDPKTGNALPAEDIKQQNTEKAEIPVSEPAVIPDAWDDAAEENRANAAAAIKERKLSTSTAGNRIVDNAEPEESESEEEDSEESDGSEYEGMSKAEAAVEKRRDTIRRDRAKERQKAMASRTADRLRSPVICILGHVDTGKTKILDRIRRTNVQDGEAGGITQQIGATYFPIDAVKKEATKVKEGKELDYNVPSLLIIDTPGHESFTNLRSRGSSLCDIAILVVDIMHGLEPQTRESIDLLKLRKTPFIVALNKIDRIYGWDAQPHNCPIRDSLEKQPKHARDEFHRRVRDSKLEFAEIGFNTELYWENSDVRKTVSFVPTSAISGEGIPDLLMLLIALPQRLLTERLMFNPLLEATVLEVKVIEGLGTTVDIILTGGKMREGDTIMVVGLDGPITATIRALLTPHPMKEMRVKGQYVHHKELEAAQGIKISADGLEKAVAGTQVLIVRDPNDEIEVEYVEEEVMKDFQTILTNVDRSGLGVYVQASTLGSLEALLEFLSTSKIPVSGINIGPVHKRDVTKASTMLEKRKEFATILAFDVIVEKEARELSEEVGVKIFTADIIYHLFDQFTAYMEGIKKQRREEVNDEVVFPSICKILPQHIYNKKDPIVVGVDVMEGILRVGTPLVVRHGNGWLDVGRVASIELNKKQVVTAKKGESVAVKIQDKNTEHIMYGRHFTFEDALVSKMSRSAIDLLKESFRDDLGSEEWRLVVKLKKMFEIL